MTPPALAAWLVVSRLAGPAAGVLLSRRAARGREDPARLAERLGRAGLARPDGRLAWLHAASVGEAVSALPLVRALRARGLGVLLTTGTVASARRMASELPEGAVHQFVPVDTAAAVRGFLNHWRPDLAIWIESELWPRLVIETARGGVPMALVNARLSEASVRRWRRAPGTVRRLLGSFRAILAQDEETVGRLRALGADARFAGNVKALVDPPGCDAAELAGLRAALGGRPVWLAASTHPGEEEVCAAAHRALRASATVAGCAGAERALASAAAAGVRAGPGPGVPQERAEERSERPLMILAPRHPERGDMVAHLLSKADLSVARRSAGEVPGAATDVWLADTLGEMGLWYRLAPLAFVGGSLVPAGGHSPFEPAGLDTAILHGPHVANFAPVYAALDGAAGALAIGGASELAPAVRALLADREMADGLRSRAREVHARLRPDLDAIADELVGLMEATA